MLWRTSSSVRASLWIREGHPLVTSGCPSRIHSLCAGKSAHLETLVSTSTDKGNAGGALPLPVEQLYLFLVPHHKFSPPSATVLSGHVLVCLVDVVGPCDVSPASDTIMIEDNSTIYNSSIPRLPPGGQDCTTASILVACPCRDVINLPRLPRLHPGGVSVRRDQDPDPVSHVREESQSSQAPSPPSWWRVRATDHPDPDKHRAGSSTFGENRDQSSQAPSPPSWWRVRAT